MRPSRPFRLHLLPLVLALAATAQPAPAQEALVETLAVRELDDRAVVVLETSEKVEWVGRQTVDGRMVLTLPDTVLAPVVADLDFPDGFVSKVTARVDSNGTTQNASIDITPRNPSSYSVVATRNELRVTVRPQPRAAGPPAARSEPPPPLATPEPTAPPALEVDPAAAPAEPTPTPPSLEETPPTIGPAVGAPRPAVAGGEYRIGPGDVLEISVFGLPDFNRTVRVLRDGSISLPLLGVLRTFGGLTLQEAEGYLASLLEARQLINEPQVSIYVKEYMSRGVSIQGAVESPGVYQMIQQRTLLEMLGEAGGLSGGSGKRAGKKIFIIRSGLPGGQGRIEIDAEQLFDQGQAELNVTLLPGDVVLVPFAQTHRVYVSGAVFDPGPVEYLSSEGITVLQAITAAGGPSERGNLGNVRIVRKLADGSEERIKINVKKIQSGKREDVALERSDTVIVGEWFL